MTTNLKSAERSTWQQIAAALRSSVASGEFAAGSRLPSRRALMKRFGAADRTVTRALQELQNEGLVIARSTTGWFVQGERGVVRSLRSGDTRTEPAMDSAAESGARSAVSTSVRIEAADQSVAEILGVSVGAEVVVVDREVRWGDEVLEVATSYLPRALAAEATIGQTLVGRGGVAPRVDVAAAGATHFTEEVGIGRAGERELTRMTVGAGEPVFRIERRLWAGERVVELAYLTATGRQFLLVYDGPIPPVSPVRAHVEPLVTRSGHGTETG